MPLQKLSLDVNCQLPVSFYLDDQHRTSSPLLIVLHGYTDSATSFLRRGFEGLDLDFDILAPNGPFPVPVKTDEGFKEAYSWYFEDHSIGRIIIPKEVTIGILKNLIEELKFEAREKIIVGFSQGGFLAPKLAEQIQNVKKIIGIGCDYRAELYENLNSIQVYGIHGTHDQVVDYEKSKMHFKALTARGLGQEFASIHGLEHKINAEAKAKIKEFILA